MIIYKIVNKINDKIYVGLTRKDVSQRVAEHIADKTYIGKALRKYGIESFVISVIDTADSVEVLKEKECYWIRTLNCKAPKGYNLTERNKTRTGEKRVYSEERNRKIGLSRFGKKYPR